MLLRCEICRNFRPEGDLIPNRPLEHITYGVRRLLLCRAHAGIAVNSGVTSFEELRELFKESNGRRSYVPRRALASHQLREVGRRAVDSH
jgi:hypothetical protein